MKSSIKSIFVVFLIVMGFILPVSAVPVISIGDIEAQPGKSIIESIMISDSNLSSGNIIIAYDPSVVHVTDVSSGSGKALSLLTGANSIDNNAGIVKITFLDVEPPQGNVILANVVFKSVGSSKSSTSLNIIDHTMNTNDYPVECKVNNGTFTVLSGTSDPSTSSSRAGGAGIPAESHENIAVRETVREYITANTTITYQFNEDANCIEYIEFHAKTNAGYINAVVEVLKYKSTQVSSDPIGEVYKYINIYVGNSGYATEKNIADPVTVFEVPLLWITQNNIDESSIKLYYYDSNAWNTLPTTKIKEENDCSYFEAEIPEFTGFAIIGETLSSPRAGGEGIEDTTSQKGINEQLSQDTETTDTDEDGIPGPGLLIGLLSIWIAVQVLQKKILP